MTWLIAETLCISGCGQRALGQRKTRRSLRNESELL